MSILFLSFNLVYSFTTCDVDFNPGSVVMNDQYDFYFNIDGDLFFENSPYSVKFGLEGSNYFSLLYDKTNIPSKPGLIYESTTSVPLILFANDGSVYSKRYIVYDGFQAGCSDDGWRNNLNNPNNLLPYGWYCNVDSITKENRDYFCDYGSDEYSSDCEYDVIDTERCDQRVSTKVGSVNYLSRDILRDYLECKSGDAYNVETGCSYREFVDVCSNTIDLKEYVPGNVGADYTIKDCDDYSGNLYCSGLKVYESLWGCSSGKCSDSSRSDSYTGTDCDFPSYYTCSGNTYSQLIVPTCSGASCGSKVASSSYCGLTTCSSSHYDYYDCNPSDCDCEIVEFECGTEENPETCSNSVCDTCYETCSTYVCDVWNIKGCSGGSCYSYLS